MPPQSTNAMGSTPASQTVPPAPKKSSLPLVIGSIILVLILAAGGYYLWQTMQPPPAPVQSETSDIEADLQSIDVGADAEVDELEAQI